MTGGLGVRLNGLAARALPMLLLVWLLCVFFPSRALGNLALGLSLLLFILLCVLDGESRRKVGGDPVFWAAGALFVVAYGVSVATGTLVSGWPTFYSYDGPGKALLIGVALLVMKREPVSFRSALAGALGLLVVLNLFQLYYFLNSPITWHPESYPMDAFYRYRNFGAMQLVLAPFLAVALFHTEKNWVRAALVAWLALNCALLASTGFRGAWLGFLVGLGVVAGWRRLLKALPYFLMAGLALFFVAASGSGDNLFFSALRRGASDNSRIAQVWHPTLLFLRDAFWLGHGFDPLAYTRVYQEKWVDRGLGSVVMPGAHNMVLGFFFQAGLLGALAYVSLVGAVIVRLWRSWKRASVETAPVFLALLGSWLGAYGVLGQTDSVNWPCFAVLFPMTTFVLAKGGE